MGVIAVMSRPRKIVRRIPLEDLERWMDTFDEVIERFPDNYPLAVRTADKAMKYGVEVEFSA